MGVLGLIVLCIVGNELINRLFDYRKTAVQAQLDDERHAQFETVLEELAAMREMMADLVISLDDRRCLPPVSTAGETQASDRRAVSDRT